MMRSSVRRYHTYHPHRVPVGALCEGSSMRTCRYALSSDRSPMRRELYAALQPRLICAFVVRIRQNRFSHDVAYIYLVKFHLRNSV